MKYYVMRQVRRARTKHECGTLEEARDLAKLFSQGKDPEFKSKAVYGIYILKEHSWGHGYCLIEDYTNGEKTRIKV